jgi:hypothetical protein
MSLQPSENAVGVHTVKTVSIDSGQKARISFTPETTGTTFSVPTVAITQRSDTSYEIETDKSTEFGPSEIPPTAPDDLAQPFPVPVEFETEMVVIIKNLSNTDGRKYHVQLIGWED